MSASSALLAGRYNSPARPARNVMPTNAQNDRACDSNNIVTAAENIESTIVLRRPIVSARYPPSGDATKCPAPYAPSVIAASFVENPVRVRYNVRNGITNVPNLFRNVPKYKIHTARGNARNVAHNPGGSSNTCTHF